MRRSILVLLMLAFLVIACSAMAGVANWDVFTVNGINQFTISPSGDGMTFGNQPNNLNVFWFNNNGSRPDELATYTTLDGYRPVSYTHLDVYKRQG